jgi:DNA-binding CsgD family transcriptional regulator
MPKTAAAHEVDAAHLQYLIRAIVAATGASTGSPQREEGCVGEHVVVDTDLDGVRYLLIRMPAAEPMRAMLSPREFEIVRMVAQGYQNKIIAGILNISTWTVCAHLRRVFAKIGVSSRAAMVARLLESDVGLQSCFGVVPKAADPVAAPRPHNATVSPRGAATQSEAARPARSDGDAAAGRPARMSVRSGDTIGKCISPPPGRVFRSSCTG